MPRSGSKVRWLLVVALYAVLVAYLSLRDFAATAYDDSYFFKRFAINAIEHGSRARSEQRTRAHAHDNCGHARDLGGRIGVGLDNPTHPHTRGLLFVATAVAASIQLTMRRPAAALGTLSDRAKRVGFADQRGGASAGYFGQVHTTQLGGAA